MKIYMDACTDVYVFYKQYIFKFILYHIRNPRTKFIAQRCISFNLQTLNEQGGHAFFWDLEENPMGVVKCFERAS